MARTLASCSIPSISAIGHEIDFTICDFVADLRAPTPSAAAELVVKNGADLMDKLQKLKTQLLQNFRFHLAFFQEKTLSLKKQLPSPERLLEHFSQKLDDLTQQLKTTIKQNLENSSNQIDSLEKILKSLSPKQVMERGFSIVTNEKGQTLKNTQNIKLKDTVVIEFLKGSASASIKNIH